jgi:hypothetical protein
MSDLWKSQDGESEIIYEIGPADCPADIVEADFGEECAAWLNQEYPKCKFLYDRDFFKVLLRPGHGLSEEQVNGVRHDARVFIQGLKQGVQVARRSRWPGSFQYSGMALLKHGDGHYEIAEMRKVIDDNKRLEGRAFPYDWRELFGDETPREFRFNREDMDEFGERNDRVLLDGPPARKKHD